MKRQGAPAGPPPSPWLLRDSAEIQAEVERLQTESGRATASVWVLLAGAIAYSAVNVALFAVKHGVPKQTAWALDLLFAVGLVVVIQADSVLARHGRHGGSWVAAARIYCGAATLTLNIWAPVAEGDPGAVLTHVVAPLLLVLLAEAVPRIRRHYAALIKELLGELRDRDQSEQATVRQSEDQRRADQRHAEDQAAAERRQVAESAAAERERQRQLEERQLEVAARQAAADEAAARTERDRVAAAVERDRLAAQARVRQAELDAERARDEAAAERERTRRDRPDRRPRTTPSASARTTPSTSARTTPGASARTTPGATPGAGGTAGAGATSGTGGATRRSPASGPSSADDLLGRARALDVQYRAQSKKPASRRVLQVALGIGTERAAALQQTLAAEAAAGGTDRSPGTTRDQGTGTTAETTAGGA